MQAWLHRLAILELMTNDGHADLAVLHLLPSTLLSPYADSATQACTRMLPSALGNASRSQVIFNCISLSNETFELICTGAPFPRGPEGDEGWQQGGLTRA